MFLRDSDASFDNMQRRSDYKACLKGLTHLLGGEPEVERVKLLAHIQPRGSRVSSASGAPSSPVSSPSQSDTNDKGNPKSKRGFQQTPARALFGGPYSSRTLLRPSVADSSRQQRPRASAPKLEGDESKQLAVALELVGQVQDALMPAASQRNLRAAVQVLCSAVTTLCSEVFEQFPSPNPSFNSGARRVSTSCGYACRIIGSLVHMLPFVARYIGADEEVISYSMVALSRINK